MPELGLHYFQSCDLRKLKPLLFTKSRIPENERAKASLLISAINCKKEWTASELAKGDLKLQELVTKCGQERLKMVRTLVTDYKGDLVFGSERLVLENEISDPEFHEDGHSVVHHALDTILNVSPVYYRCHLHV